MVWNKIRSYLIPILSCVGGLVFKFLAETSFFDWLLIKFFGQELLMIKDVLRAIAVFASFVPLSIRLIIVTERAKGYFELLYNYGEIQRELIKNVLNNKMFEKSVGNINIRIFKKKFGSLICSEVDGFTRDKLKRRLKFNIKKLEGVVSSCYTRRCTLLELENCLANDYNLTEYNKAIVNGTKFVAGVCVCDPSRKIRCIVTFDAQEKVRIRAGKTEELLTFLETSAYTIAETIEGRFD